MHLLTLLPPSILSYLFTSSLRAYNDEPRITNTKTNVIEPLCYSLMPPPKAARKDPPRYASQTNIAKYKNAKEIDELIQKLAKEATKYVVKGTENSKMASLNGFVKDYYGKNTVTAQTRKAYSLNKYNKILWSAKKAKMSKYDTVTALKFPFAGVMTSLQSWNSPHPLQKLYCKGIARPKRNITLSNALSGNLKEKPVGSNKTVVNPEKAQPNNLKPELNKTNPPVYIDICNAVVNGKKLNCSPAEKMVQLTSGNKKQIILAMLKEGKIPIEIIVEHEKSMKNVKSEEERLEKLAEGILGTYDVIVQEAGPKPEENGIKRNSSPKRSVTRADTNRKADVARRLSPIKCTAETGHNIKREERKTVPITLPVSPPRKVLKQEGSPVKCVKLREEPWKLPAGVKEGVINETIWLINKYTALTTRNREHHYDLKAINYLHRKLGLGKPIQSEEEFKSRERICQLKETLLRILYSTLNKENTYTPESGVTPKFFIGAGNNSPLVKSLMRERWWWSPAEDSQRTNNMLWTQWRMMEFISTLSTTANPTQENPPRLCNHLEGNYYLGYKKTMYKCFLLYYTLLGKDISEVIPLTFHVKSGKIDPEYLKFKALYHKYEAELKEAQQFESEEEEEEEVSEENVEDEKVEECNKNVWIVKPGENTNRGNGIFVAKDIQEIEVSIADTSHTYIIQKYIERPLLFEKRKFDIRCFALVTSVNGYIKAYYYQEGYLRTSSKDYSVDNLSKYVHLTNEAIQIRYEGFGKHEAGNKISYAEFQKYLEDASRGNKDKSPVNFYKDILPKIKVYTPYFQKQEIITDTIKSVYPFIDKKRRLHTFELFGYDFMIDEALKVYLIEANINPCLSVTSSFSSRFIPALVDNTLRIAIDPLFPPPPEFASKKGAGEVLPEIKYELIFDQRVDGAELDRLYEKADMSKWGQKQKCR
eukprot:TRINITY_DN583_c0_g2_i1.p1 TRINITY_DN583_c0_g2~~TRINITY_DN583_c0_g2_i1.p1  ORF type:complete len:933 (+),score=109.88 TRINITY_DN583_c0_g2_i1:11362-14160(+)